MQDPNGHDRARINEPASFPATRQVRRESSGVGEGLQRERLE